MEKTAEHHTDAAARQTRMLVMTALFAALGYVATRVLQVPSPSGGYLNLGDAVVLLGAYLLGPVYGAAAGGLGPALADLLSGYAAWVPGTLCIKALMGLTAALLYRGLGKRSWALPVCGLAAEAIMVAGYFVYEALALQLGMGAAAGVLANVGQGAVGLVIALVLMALLKGSKALDKLAVQW